MTVEADTEVRAESVSLYPAQYTCDAREGVSRAKITALGILHVRAGVWRG